MLDFQWDMGNENHIINDYPLRANTIEEVESLFFDPTPLALPDPKHSGQEERFKLVARSNQNRLLLVVYVIRNGQIRPISCRPASQNERNRYDQVTQKT
ncbi:BrnT family toxin [Microcoleus sp. herbarium14]